MIRIHEVETFASCLVGRQEHTHFIVIAEILQTRLPLLLAASSVYLALFQVWSDSSEHFLQQVQK